MAEQRSPESSDLGGPVEQAQEAELNIFADANSVDELLSLMVGAGSVCWVGGTGDLVFDSEMAIGVVAHGMARLEELISEPITNILGFTK